MTISYPVWVCIRLLQCSRLPSYFLQRSFSSASTVHKSTSVDRRKKTGHALQAERNLAAISSASDMETAHPVELAISNALRKWSCGENRLYHDKTYRTLCGVLLSI